MVPGIQFLGPGRSTKSCSEPGVLSNLILRVSLFLRSHRLQEDCHTRVSCSAPIHPDGTARVPSEPLAGFSRVL